MTNFLDNNKKALNELKYHMRLYEKRRENMADRLEKTGQIDALSREYKLQDLTESVQNYQQVKSIINHMGKLRVEALGKAIDGKYENVIEGKKGAMILKVEHDKMNYDYKKMNKKKKQDREQLAKEGMETAPTELADFKYNIDDVNQDSLDVKVRNYTSKSLITSFLQAGYDQRRESMKKAARLKFNSEANIICNMLDQLSDLELDTFIREDGSAISFEFFYSDVAIDEHVEQVLHQFKIFMGADKYNNIVSSYGRDDLVHIIPESITVDLDIERVEKIRFKAKGRE